MILARQTYSRFASLTPFTIVKPAGGDGDGNGRETKLLVLLVTFKDFGGCRVLMVAGAITASAEPKSPSRTANVEINFIFFSWFLNLRIYVK